ncbi:MAG: Nif11 family protein [Bacteroidales bacterium]|nr:Nif11 family protein [Bacteroidales bacterium]
MPINNVVRLVNDIDQSISLRENLYKCNNSSEVIAYLSQNSYPFTRAEFEDALSMLNFRCQTEEEAVTFKEKAMWLRFLLKFEEE